MPTATETPDLLTREEVADLCRVCPKTVGNWVRSGRLRPHSRSRPGGRLFRRADVEAVLADPPRRGVASPARPVVPDHVLHRLLWGHYRAGGTDAGAVALVEWAERAAVAFACLAAAARGELILTMPAGHADPDVLPVREAAPEFAGRSGMARLTNLFGHLFPEPEGHDV